MTRVVIDRGKRFAPWVFEARTVDECKAWLRHVGVRRGLAVSRPSALTQSVVGWTRQAEDELLDLLGHLLTKESHDPAGT